jgi:very-short-patch-repair endonuclease
MRAGARLVVEVDGGYLERRATTDARRDRELAKVGCRIVRVQVELVIRDLPTIVLAAGQAFRGP